MQPCITRGGLLAALGILISVGTFAPHAAAQENAAAQTEALTAKGAWSPAVTYRRDDIVTARGSTWRARKLNKGKVPGQTQPSTAAFWELLAAGFNPKGAWLSTRKYQPNDLVTATGSTWRAKRTNINKAPVAGPNWEQFAARGAAGPNTGVSLGSQSAPAISFDSDADTGIFSPEEGKIALVENGALFLHNLGTDNTAVGQGALAINTGSINTAVGGSALVVNTTGSFNTALGGSALFSNTTGSNNIALGVAALLTNTTGFSNTAVGRSALVNNTTGARNTVVGASALSGNTGGNENIAIGRLAGAFATSSDASIFIGNTGLTDDDATIRIGTQGAQTSTFIAGIHGATSASGIAVLVNSNGQLGTTTSSRRYKEDIAATGDVGPVLAKLRPVTFRYKQAAEDGSKPLQYGLIAEEVEEISRDLVAYNRDGSVETVRYHFLPPLLLAGWQAQQKTIAAQAERIETQADEIAELKRRLAAIEASLPRTKAAAWQ